MTFYKNISRIKYIYYKIKTAYYYKTFLKSCGRNNIIFKPVLFTPECIILNNDIFIRDNCRIEGVFHFEGVNYNPVITLNNNINIEQNLHLTCANSIIIGRDTAISANVTITDIIHSYQNVDTIYKKQQFQVKEVSIGENCLILNNAVILPGVVMGNNCVVGANSVVTEGIYPDFSVLVGSPARIVKRYDSLRKAWIK